MRIIRTEKQKDNLSKTFWDLGKIIFTILVVSPFAKPQSINIINIILNIIICTAFWAVGYILDGKEVKS